MRAYSLAALESMKSNITELTEDLSFKLEKTSVPRPQALGSISSFLFLYVNILRNHRIC